jgi:hypothetical protein
MSESETTTTTTTTTVETTVDTEVPQQSLPAQEENQSGTNEKDAAPEQNKEEEEPVESYECKF